VTDDDDEDDGGDGGGGGNDDDDDDGGEEDVFQRAFAYQKQVVTKGFCLRILMCCSTTNSSGED
jgi:hypothetical protein